MSSDAVLREEIEGQQRYLDVSEWMRRVMGNLFQLTIALPAETDFDELAVTAIRQYQDWKLCCVCSVRAHAGALKQVDAQRGVSAIAIEDAEKRYWRHPYRDGDKAKAYYSGTKGNVSVSVTLETLE